MYSLNKSFLLSNTSDLKIRSMAVTSGKVRHLDEDADNFRIVLINNKINSWLIKVNSNSKKWLLRLRPSSGRLDRSCDNPHRQM